MKFLLPKLSMPRRALFLSGGILALSVVYFMIVPLLALYLSTELQASAGQIGIVLAVLAIANQGSQVFIGAISDRWGPKAVLSVGIFVDCIGYLGFAAAPSFPFQVILALALGLGTATVSLLGKVILAEEAKDNRAAAFALRAAAINIGAAAGPVIGSVFFGRFEAALIITAAVFALFWVILIRPMPSRK
ncbi:MAG: MFS transporter, partial [Geminicoccaceae bacterium]